MSSLPLLRHHRPDSVIAWRDRRAVQTRAFLADVAALAERLPEYEHVINLCEDRYRFLVGFAAALVREQTTLLPPSRAPGAIGAVAADWPATYCLSDSALAPSGVPVHRYQEAATPLGSIDFPVLDAHQPAAILFTSGSTGKPAPHRKSWGSLASGAHAAAQRLGLDRLHGAVLVGTVPHQHMYGLEAAIMLTLQGGLALYSGRPFYPADIADALAQAPAPRVLVTTPLHLKACVGEGAPLPPVEFALSSTAALPQALARAAESLLRAPVYEVYGCTEGGAIATRRSAHSLTWETLDDYRWERGDHGPLLRGRELPDPVPLNDVLEFYTERKFVLLGRHGDLINIAGKRMSLADLNHKLHDIPGVIDGAFFMPEESDECVTRLMAFVVAPDLSDEQILARLARDIDPVFLPRPLVRVVSLARNETGKLPREHLARLAAQALKPDARTD
jgi:acyl-coenzyme A synthetase/AMP-(fatty) acid ligase